MQQTLHSLQNISRSVALVQNRLATGKKVNSAIDNPNSFYTATALTTRAKDLSSLLDAMGQSIQMIKNASQTLDTGLDMLELAKSVASKTLDESYAGAIPSIEDIANNKNVMAVVQNEKELLEAINSGKTGDIVIYGKIDCSNGIKLKKGQNLCGVGKYGVKDKVCDKFSQLCFKMDSTKQDYCITNQDDICISDLSVKATTGSELFETQSVIKLNDNYDVEIKNIDIYVDDSIVVTKKEYHNFSFVSGGYNLTLKGVNTIENAGNHISQLVGCGIYHCHGEFLNEGILNIDLKYSIQSKGLCQFHKGFNNSGEINIDSSAVELSSRGISEIKDSLVNTGKININCRNLGQYEISNCYGIDTVQNGIVNNEEININLMSKNKISFGIWNIGGIVENNKNLNIKAYGNTVQGIQEVQAFINKGQTNIHAISITDQSIGLAILNYVENHGELNILCNSKNLSCSIYDIKLDFKNYGVANLVAYSNSYSCAIAEFSGNLILENGSKTNIIAQNLRINDRSNPNMEIKKGAEVTTKDKGLGGNIKISTEEGSKINQNDKEYEFGQLDKRNTNNFAGIAKSVTDKKATIDYPQGMDDKSLPKEYPKLDIVIRDDFKDKYIEGDEISNNNEEIRQAESDGLLLRKTSMQQYENILSQYDLLMNDGEYKGINLLQEEKMTVAFNEDRSSNFVIEGKDMSSGALGINKKNWEKTNEITNSIKELDQAIENVRSYMGELGSNLSIITGRSEFTESIVNILTEGSDKLILADMNAESANMLACQVRHQLANNSLFLASNAAKAVLKLFN